MPPVQSGLVLRARDGIDSRVVRLGLTDEGARRIEQLSELHLAELGWLAPVIEHLTVAAPPVPT